MSYALASLAVIPLRKGYFIIEMMRGVRLSTRDEGKIVFVGYCDVAL